MIHFLLGVAVVLFILWLIFFHLGSIVHLLWIGILIALALWVFGFFFRGRRGARRGI
ncbi:MAG: hydrophobic protein [Candidatus Dormibacteraeota bacterium]|nr:hydrophobic protein [Candidatus Dormibacteraeota bacterium]